MVNCFKLKRFRLAALFLAMAVIFGVVGCVEQEQPETKSKEQRLFDYQESELVNGMKVITLEDFSCPIVAVQVWYHVGSKDEDPARQGFAHMFEHMMFKGTDRVGPKDHFDLIHGVGGTNNGYTSFDRTVYLQTVPVNQIELALWLEAERMSFLKIDQESFDTERKVVEEELRLKFNKPYGTLEKKIAAEMFKIHPYRWLPIGKLDHLRAASVAELRDFWGRYYVPNNSALLIVGAIKHDKAVELAKQYFEWIPREDEPGKVTIREPEPQEAKTIIIDDENAPAALAGIIWPTVPLGHGDEVVLDLLGEILGGGNSSRMYRQLVAEDQTAVSSMATTWNLEHTGLFIAGAMQAPGIEAEAIIKATKKHIKDIQNDGIKQAELEKAKNQMLRSVVTTNLTIDSKARMLGTATIEKGDTSRVNTMLDEIGAVDKDDIKRVAKKYLVDERSYTVIVKKNDSGALAGEKINEDAAVAVEREQIAPPSGRKGVVRPNDFPVMAPLAEVADFDPTPKFTEVKLDNGLKVMVVANHEVPFVSVKLGLGYGAWAEARPSTAAMTLNMLTKGTEKYSEEALAAELEQYAITLFGSAGMDTSQVNTSFLSEQAERAMALLGQVVLAPTFDEAEFEKLRVQTVTALEVKAQSPRYLVEKEFRKRLYGGHPYARTVAGGPEDVKKLTAGDLKLWWRKFARPDKSVLIFAGDITMEKAVELAEKNLGQWKTDLVEMGIVLADFPKIEKTEIFVVDRPGSAQSEIRVGQFGFTRRAQPDYFISRIVCNYFGWSFNSRLNESIRVKQGLTYGVWGGYYAQNMAGEFKISTFTKTEKTGEMVRAIIEQIELLKQNPPSEKELAGSKNYLTGSFVRNREIPQQVADDLWLIESQKLGADYLQRLLAQVKRTTKEDCDGLVDKTLDTNKLVITVVGDAQKIVAGLEEIAPVTIAAVKE